MAWPNSIVRIGRRGGHGNGMADCNALPLTRIPPAPAAVRLRRSATSRRLPLARSRVWNWARVSTRRRLRVGSTAVISSDCNSASIARCCLRSSGMRRQRSSSERDQVLLVSGQQPLLCSWSGALGRDAARLDAASGDRWFGLPAAGDLAPSEASWIFQQPHNLLPHYRIAAAPERYGLLSQTAPFRCLVAIPSQAAIVVDRALGSSRRSSVESITTTLTDQPPATRMVR